MGAREKCPSFILQCHLREISEETWIWISNAVNSMIPTFRRVSIRMEALSTLKYIPNHSLLDPNLIRRSMMTIWNSFLSINRQLSKQGMLRSMNLPYIFNRTSKNWTTLTSGSVAGKETSKKDCWTPAHWTLTISSSELPNHQKLATSYHQQFTTPIPENS